MFDDRQTDRQTFSLQYFSTAAAGEVTREMCNRIDMHTHIVPHLGPSQPEILKPQTEGQG